MRIFQRLGVFIYLALIPYLLWNCAGTPDFHPPASPTKITSRNLRIDSTIVSDPEVEAVIRPYRAELNKTMGQIVGHAAMRLEKDKPEAPLNNFVADLMLKRANKEYDKPVQVAITNVGGLRRDIPKGPISLRVIYEVMPFNNALVILEMTGNQIITLGRQIGEVYGECISGMHLEFLNRNLSRITVQGASVESDSIYRVVTTDYLSSPGRERLDILTLVPRRFLGIKLREAILDEVKNLEAAGQQAAAKVEGRIIFRERGNRK